MLETRTAASRKAVQLESRSLKNGGAQMPFA